jgi:hypothetical protein
MKAAKVKINEDEQLKEKTMVDRLRSLGLQGELLLSLYPPMYDTFPLDGHLCRLTKSYSRGAISSARLKFVN